MRINSLAVYKYNSLQTLNSPKTTSFSGGVRKMSNSTQEKLCELLVTENLKSVKMTFDDAVKILRGVGCRVTRKSGSHATAHKDGCAKPFSFPEPHEEGGSNIPTVYLLKMKKFLTETVREIG